MCVFYPRDPNSSRSAARASVEARPVSHFRRSGGSGITMMRRRRETRDWRPTPPTSARVCASRYSVAAARVGETDSNKKPVSGPRTNFSLAALADRSFFFSSLSPFLLLGQLSPLAGDTASYLSSGQLVPMYRLAERQSITLFHVYSPRGVRISFFSYAARTLSLIGSFNCVRAKLSNVRLSTWNRLS